MGSLHPAQPQGVHFVGSVPPGLATKPSEVFSSFNSSLPGRLRRMPDGELGERFYYVNWQVGKFSRAVVRRQHMAHTPADMPPVDTSYQPTLEVDVAPLGYAEAALESYAEFCKARDAAGATGTGAGAVRFQVSLPLPAECVGIHVEPCFQRAVAPLYERRMLDDLAAIQAVIPPHDLAVQWDVAVCVGFMEYESGRLAHPFFKPWAFDTATAADATQEGRGEGGGGAAGDDIDLQTYITQQAGRMAAALDPGVQLGFHLCYGDINHAHFIEPADTRLLVNLANQLRTEVKRQQKLKASSVSVSGSGDGGGELAWVHMPVPKDRADDAYFEPLRDLELASGTQLFLGLLHPHDLDGTRQRIAAAQKVVPAGFGVATECGCGRTPMDDYESILEIAREVALPY